MWQGVFVVVDVRGLRSLRLNRGLCAENRRPGSGWCGGGRHGRCETGTLSGGPRHGGDGEMMVVEGKDCWRRGNVATTRTRTRSNLNYCLAARPAPFLRARETLKRQLDSLDGHSIALRPLKKITYKNATSQFSVSGHDQKYNTATRRLFMSYAKQKQPSAKINKHKPHLSMLFRRSSRFGPSPNLGCPANQSNLCRIYDSSCLSSMPTVRPTSEAIRTNVLSSTARIQDILWIVVLML